MNKGIARLRAKSTILILFVSALLLLNISLLAAGYYFYDIVMNYNKTNSYSFEDYQKEVVNVGFDINRFNSLEKEYVTLDSSFGYQLKGIFIKNAAKTQDTVILVHGIGKDKTWSYMKYGNIFLDYGYNVFVFDSRNHGESGGNHPSYGFYEREDLQTCTSYVKSKSPEGVLGIHGESMGAATVLLWTEKYNGDVSFCIEDCGYSDLHELFYERLTDYNIPRLLRPLILNYASLVCRVKEGFFLSEVSPIQKIDKVKMPVMFIHGDKDDFVPPEMANELFNKKNGMKALYYAQGAGHAKSINVDKVKYREEINSFLKGSALINKAGTKN